MTTDKLIARLSRELYDLKQKLEDIRHAADRIYNDANGKSLTLARLESIKILNLIDESVVYED